MDLTTSGSSYAKDGVTKSYEDAKSLQANLIWQRLETITVDDAVEAWLLTLANKTQINYRSGLRKLVEHGLFSPAISLQAFALVNHESILDQIKQIQEWSECTRQARAACYLSFTRFLDRRTRGMIPKAKPSREGHSRTFFKVHEKVKTKAMTQYQWIAFLEKLETISLRELLIAKLSLQGGKRINEVLSLVVSQVDWERRKITFQQSKSKGTLRSTIITYPESVINQLKRYVGERKGLVFVTRNGKKVGLTHIAQVFAKSGSAAGITFKVTPHVLRASTVTYLKQQGFQDSDIMKVTGHASSEMVHAYDKSSQEINASEKISLVS